MASIIRVKRSTGTSAPGSLNFGELGLTVGVGTHGNLGGRVFAGDKKVLYFRDLKRPRNNILLSANDEINAMFSPPLFIFG